MPIVVVRVEDAAVAEEHIGPRLPPPYADYLEGVSWRGALDHVEQVAREHPELAPRLLAWLIAETRRAMLDELPPHGPDQGWFKITSATWWVGTDDGRTDAVSD